MPQLLSIGQIIDHSWEMYRKRFMDLLSISAWLFLPTLVGVVALALYPGASTLLSGRVLNSTEMAGVILWMLSSFVMAPIAATIIFVMLVRLIMAQINGKRAATSLLLKDARRLFWPLVLVNLLIIAVLILPWGFTLPGWLLMALPGVTIKAIGSFLLSIGIILAAVVSVRWLILYSYAAITVSAEERRGRSALRRARSLVEGRFWSALLRMTVPKIIFFVVAAAATGLLAELVDTPVRSYVGLNADLYLRLSGIITLLLASSTAVILNPLLLITDCLIYENLRETMKPSKS